MSTPADDSDAKKTEHLGFRVNPETKRKVLAVAAMDDVHYAEYFRHKARELADRYDRTVQLLGGDQRPA